MNRSLKILAIVALCIAIVFGGIKLHSEYRDATKPTTSGWKYSD